MFVKKQVRQVETPIDKLLRRNNRTLMFTVVISVGLSTLVGVGFAYMGYTSGELSEAYTLFKNDVLSQASLGEY